MNIRLEEASAAGSFHLIHTRNVMRVSRRRYADWREIEAEYPDYMASLGPWTWTEMRDYLTEEYPSLFPGPAEQLAGLVSGGQVVVTLTFRDGET